MLCPCGEPVPVCFQDAGLCEDHYAEYCQRHNLQGAGTSRYSSGPSTRRDDRPALTESERAVYREPKRNKKCRKHAE
jgi:hypothetical protein